GPPHKGTRGAILSMQIQGGDVATDGVVEGVEEGSHEDETGGDDGDVDLDDGERGGGEGCP
ncbi:MAG: hypothetical protein LQ347_003927, partial [Umbilicaria vellea]